MKKLLAALLTFTIGVFAFDLFSMKSVGELTPTASEQSVVGAAKAPVVLISYENVVTKKDRIRKPFFDSFGVEKYNDKDEYQGYYGWFIPEEFKGMPEVWTIWFSRNDENSTGEELAWEAAILTTQADGSPNDDDDFHSVQIKTEGNHLSFKTNKIRGIEYRFDGKFLRNGADFEPEEKVLRGTMRKIVRGRQIAKFTADFGYYEPHCFH